MNNNKNKLDFKTLNQLIKTGSILLKIALATLLLAIGAILIYLLDKTNVLGVLFNILTLISPLFIGIVIAWLLEPAINYFVKNKVDRRLSAFVVYLIFLFFIIFILALIVPEFISQVNELIKKVPDFLGSINNFITNIFRNFASSEVDLTNIKNNLLNSINNFVNNFTTDNLQVVVEKLSSSIKVFTNLVLSLLIAFYLSLDFSKVGKYINIVIPKKYHEELKPLKKNLNDMLRSYVNGTLLSCLFVLVLSLIGFLISGVSSPLLFAIFCAITNIIPYFGPYIGGIPVVIVGFAINPITGIICLITVFLVQFLEGNILHPLIIGKAVSLHPVTMMLSLLVFEYFFGITGMILAAPIVATLKIVYLYFANKYDLTNKIKLKI